jgi:hypothetical protein
MLDAVAAFKAQSQVFKKATLYTSICLSLDHISRTRRQRRYKNNAQLTGDVSVLQGDAFNKSGIYPRVSQGKQSLESNSVWAYSLSSC